VTWYFVAPSQYHGNFEAAYGQRLQYDLRIEPDIDNFDNADIILGSSDTGGAAAETISLHNIATPSATWSTVSAPLDTSVPWRKGTKASGSLANEEEIRSVLRYLSAVEIRGEFYRSAKGDRGFLDNILFEVNCD